MRRKKRCSRPGAETKMGEVHLTGRGRGGDGAETLLVELCQPRLVHSYIKKKKGRGEENMKSVHKFGICPRFHRDSCQKNPLEHLDN